MPSPLLPNPQHKYTSSYGNLIEKKEEKKADEPLGFFYLDFDRIYNKPKILIVTIHVQQMK